MVDAVDVCRSSAGRSAADGVDRLCPGPASVVRRPTYRHVRRRRSGPPRPAGEHPAPLFVDDLKT